MSTPEPGTTLLEAAVRQERLVTAVLVLVTLVSWTWIAAMSVDMYGAMRGAAAWMMTTQWDFAHLALLFAMWAVMMTAMMLPSAAPLVLLYAAALRSRGERSARARIYALAAGYLAVWLLFGAGATILQHALASALVVSPMMEPATPILAAIVLALAGVYQLTPLKRACLTVCRSPLAYLLRRWPADARGALLLGLRHGVYCLGCCWALMLLLFAGGVMNLYVIVALMLWVLIEKWSSLGERAARASGVALLALAAWSLIA